MNLTDEYELKARFDETATQSKIERQVEVINRTAVVHRTPFSTLNLRLNNVKQDVKKAIANIAEVAYLSYGKFRHRKLRKRFKFILNHPSYYKVEKKTVTSTK